MTALQIYKAALEEIGAAYLLRRPSGDVFLCKFCDSDTAVCEETDQQDSKHRCLGAVARAALEAAAKVPFLTGQSELTIRLAKKFGAVVSSALVFEILEEVDAYQRGAR